MGLDFKRAKEIQTNQGEKMKTLTHKIKKLAKSPMTWKVLTVGVFMGLSNIGYSADVNKEIESQVALVQKVIFDKGVRMIVMLFGITWGFFKTVLSGTFQPLLLYGGLGCCFFFVPKLINLLGGIGG